MDSPDILSPCNSRSTSDTEDLSVGSSDIMKVSSIKNKNIEELQQQAIGKLSKPNVPNLNIPERIVICLDICYDIQNTVFKLGDGTSFTPINMLKRVLDFLIHSKHAINKKTEFALLIMKNTDAIWIQNFTSNVKEIISCIDHIHPEESTSENFDFIKVFDILKQKVEIPEMKQGHTVAPPYFSVRMIVLYGRCNCVPIIPQEDDYFTLLKMHSYFSIDILLAHEEDCNTYKCKEVYDALQDLDNGYSYVFEVSRNATKIHDSVAKLLAHPLQRPLQKNTDYSFGSRHGLVCM